ncbi:HEPN domain-containing protein [Geoglobus sp.]
MHDEIAEQISMAEECLEEAKLLLSSEYYRGAASRAYYAMFHAAKAMLLAKNISPKRHVGVLRMLGVEFVNKGYLEETYAEAYKLAFDIRMDADYEGGLKLSKEMAEQVVHDAEEFLKKARIVIEQIASE